MSSDNGLSFDSGGDEDNKTTSTTNNNKGGKVESKVAHASKRAREKRKQEVESLKKENEKLRLEREMFLQHMEDLQNKVIEMREKDGDVDLVLENELLKTQLEEHRLFIQNLTKMGLVSPSSSTEEKKKLYRQGVDYALNKIQSLLSSTTRQSSEWKLAKSTPEVNLIPGTVFQVHYQVVPDFSESNVAVSRLNIRSDHFIPNVDAKFAGDFYWSLWTNIDLVRMFFQNSPATTNNFVDVTLHDELMEEEEIVADASLVLGVKSLKNNLMQREKLCTICTKEQVFSEPSSSSSTSVNNEEPGIMNNIFVACKGIADFSLSTLNIPEFSLPDESNSSSGKKKKRKTNDGNANVDEASFGNNKRVSTYLCARSSTRQDPNDDFHSISSLYVEGSVCWNVEGENGCRISSIISFPETFPLSYFKNSFADVVDLKTNTISPVFQRFAAEFTQLLLMSKTNASSSSSFNPFASSNNKKE